MPLIDNTEIICQIRNRLLDILKYRKDELIMEPFTKDFSLRFCWSSNALEGNTLTLEETISVIEYDEVQGGHTYSEYREAKNLYASVQKYLVPIQPRLLSETWLKQVNGTIMGDAGEYRKKNVYIGTLAEAVYYPPVLEKVPELMQEFMKKWNQAYLEMEGRPFFSASAEGSELSLSEGNTEQIECAIEMIAKEHLEFESIHPFLDGNGRTGRMLMNQRMVNLGFLPIAITPAGDYRRSFRRAEKNGDLSPIVHLVCKSELEAIGRVQGLVDKCSEKSQLPDQPI